jgi:hypothetical protein
MRNRCFIIPPINIPKLENFRVLQKPDQGSEQEWARGHRVALEVREASGPSRNQGSRVAARRREESG